MQTCPKNCYNFSGHVIIDSSTHIKHSRNNNYNNYNVLKCKIITLETDNICPTGPITEDGNRCPMLEFKLSMNLHDP